MFLYNRKDLYMKKIKIKQHHIDKAKNLSNNLGILKNSITSGEGNIAGFIGEVVVAEFLEAEHNNTYDSDLTWLGNITIDVKTKRTTVEPKDYYECSIAAYNTKQNCDLYAFCRVNSELDTLWFLGMIPKETYFKNARFLKKGQLDGDNGFIVKADCYNMEIKYIWYELEKLIGLKTS